MVLYKSIKVTNESLQLAGVTLDDLQTSPTITKKVYFEQYWDDQKGSLRKKGLWLRRRLFPMGNNEFNADVSLLKISVQEDGVYQIDIIPEEDAFSIYRECGYQEGRILDTFNDLFAMYPVCSYIWKDFKVEQAVWDIRNPKDRQESLLIKMDNATQWKDVEPMGLSIASYLWKNRDTIAEDDAGIYKLTEHYKKMSSLVLPDPDLTPLKQRK